jgi:hypothetical protein
VTRTEPHIPLHCPPETLEWNRHRNLNVPFELNTRDVLCPVLMVVFLDQFDEYDVTVWLLQVDFQITLAPLAIVTLFGEKKLHLAPIVVDAWAGSI